MSSEFDKGSALAGMQWLGGVQLARYFDENFTSQFFEGKRVLEASECVSFN